MAASSYRAAPPARQQGDCLGHLEAEKRTALLGHKAQPWSNDLFL